MVITETRLRHLVSVARHGHFGLAAASLGISQPALSKSIQGLEAALGVQLLDRQPDRVVPTTHGQMVMRYGTEMLNSQKEMLANLKSLNNLDSGRVNVGFGPYPSLISGYPAAARLLAKHPKISLSLEIRDWREVLAAVIENRVDFGVAEQNELETDARFQFDVLGTHSGRLFCDPGHPILRRPHYVSRRSPVPLGKQSAALSRQRRVPKGALPRRPYRPTEWRLRPQREI